MENTCALESGVAEEEGRLREQIREKGTSVERKFLISVSYGRGITCWYGVCDEEPPEWVNTKISKVKLFDKRASKVRFHCIGVNTRHHVHEVMQRINVGKIETLEFSGQKLEDDKILNRMSFACLCRYIPKVWIFLKLSHLSLSSNQLEIIFNNIGNIHTLEINLCKIHTKGVKIWPNRTPRISQLLIHGCFPKLTNSEMIPIYLQNLLICFSNSSIKDSLTLISGDTTPLYRKKLRTLFTLYSEPPAPPNLSSKSPSGPSKSKKCLIF
ncbi:unnamed protein product [Moneuplotes crassus]|uniref:Uncharacterized protein n=1 Tax=Euplotes crassus TaxID=5936 RepID=A0AAD2D335_EUPCR|nr:unnamed protein product [Moneuplotes crassus]